MFKLQHQFNNIVESTQLTNNQMPKFHYHCECSKCPPPAPGFNTSFQLLNLRSLSQLCQCVLKASSPDNLKSFLEFGDCFWLCFKLTVSLQHCTPHAIIHWIYTRQICRPLVLFGKIWTVGLQPVLCIACCVCWHAILLEDEFSGQLTIALKER